MEDRETPGLYLELVDAEPAAYRERAERLLARAGARRVTWWANSLPGRDELPMRVPDARLLGVVEVDGRFTAPDDPGGAAVAHLFHRHPRPSQGILTGRPTTGLLVVWISPRDAGVDRRFRDWADFVHIRHIAAAGIEGFTQISVYENAAGTDPRYMHFYEFDTADAEATFKKMTPAVAPRLGGRDSDAFREWADWHPPGGRLFYCNTFSLLGETA